MRKIRSRIEAKAKWEESPFSLVLNIPKEWSSGLRYLFFYKVSQTPKIFRLFREKNHIILRRIFKQWPIRRFYQKNLRESLTYVELFERVPSLVEQTQNRKWWNHFFLFLELGWAPSWFNLALSTSIPFIYRFIQWLFTWSNRWPGSNTRIHFRVMRNSWPC